jgi:glycine/D-amino acid oxidase-like deaminating enzyme
MRRLLRFFLIVIIAGLSAVAGAAQVEKNADVVIYGGTCAAVTAAVQAQRMGKSVIIVCPEKHLGGMSSGGLGFTDVGDKSVIGGLSREFYHRIWRHYQEPPAWRWQKREEFGNRGQGTAAVDLDKRTMWVFEPHVAERVFEDFIAEHKIPVYRDEWLDRQSGVQKDGTRILDRCSAERSSRPHLPRCQL